MQIDTLEDLYIEQLKDVYSANQQAMEVTKEMVQAAKEPRLIKALSLGVEGIQEGLNSIEGVIERRDASAQDAFCKGMEGLAKEARTDLSETTFGGDAVKDAMIITQYQRLVHYAIAGYGCLAAFADRLKLDKDVAVLKDCLDAAYNGDRTMTDLATGGINKAAIG